MKLYVKNLQVARDILSGKPPEYNVEPTSEEATFFSYAKRLTQVKEKKQVQECLAEIEVIKNPIYRDYALYLLVERSYRFLRYNREELAILQEMIDELPHVTRSFFQGVHDYNMVHQGLSDNPTKDITSAYSHFEHSQATGYEFINQSWLYTDDTLKAMNYAVSFETVNRLAEWTSFSPDDIVSITHIGPEKLPSAKHAHVIGVDVVYLEKYFDQLYDGLEPHLDTVDLIVLIEGKDAENHPYIAKYPRVRFYKTVFDFKDRKSMFTVIRFRMVLHALNANYETVISTDVDVKVRDNYKKFFSEHDSDIVLMRANGALVPWRGNDAKMVMFRQHLGSSAARELILHMLKIVALRYRPTLNPQGNKQWFIDQYCLGILLDGVSFGLLNFDGLSFASIKPNECPVYSADMVGKTKSSLFELDD